MAPAIPRPMAGSSIPAAPVEDAGDDLVLDAVEVPELLEELAELPLDLVADDPAVVDVLPPLGDPVETVPLLITVLFPPDAPFNELEGTVASVVFKPAGMPAGPVGTKLAGVVTGRLWEVTTVGWVVTGFGCEVAGDG